MKKLVLSREEKAIERALLRGEFRPVKKAEFERTAAAIARLRKDAVVSIRVNSQDLRSLKKKAKRLGVPYQSFVAELIHRYAA